MVNCAVFGCKRRSKSANLKLNGVSYHIFPKDPLLRRQWIKFCGKMDTWIPTRTSVICSDHFEPGCFQSHPSHNQRRRLIDDARPTIFSGYKIIKVEPEETVHKTNSSIPVLQVASPSVNQYVPSVALPEKILTGDQEKSNNETKSFVFLVTAFPSGIQSGTGATLPVNISTADQGKPVIETNDTHAEVPANLPSGNQPVNSGRLPGNVTTNTKSRGKFVFVEASLAKERQLAESQQKFRSQDRTADIRTYMNKIKSSLAKQRKLVESEQMLRKLENTVRIRKLLDRIKFQSIKIKRLQSKTRYLEKKVCSLKEILKESHEGSID